MPPLGAGVVAAEVQVPGCLVGRVRAAAPLQQYPHRPPR
jgi:hypothetical protein